MKLRLIPLLAALALSGTTAVAQGARDAIAAALAAADRPASDVSRDPDRQPEALLRFAGVRPGQRVADLMSGEGYFTRLFSAAVGADGRVYAIVPSELAQVQPKAVEAMSALTRLPGYGNVQLATLPTAAVAAPEPLDLAWTSDNYHDLYAFFGPDRAAAFDRAVFAALKPGGVFVVIDHRAAPGADIATVRRLHRIDPEVVKAQALAAGFRLDGESAVLANPADTLQQPVFTPGIRGRTDQFALRFRKPR